ncbi:hypothetical protein SLEP1_g10625 [Rubroshorea leprosula]|uniref:Uncharacterized protein n=1 Tax=Rubroshorea leprosula TaxID=152421 RepID=A0AAV5IEK3_9ROSI|nr:hypothetical protein SLEP1_g10625 [Rubroshorea leprosula]
MSERLMADSLESQKQLARVGGVINWFLARVGGVINWFLGHMAVATRTIHQPLKLSDLIIKVRVAQIPLSSAHEELPTRQREAFFQLGSDKIVAQLSSTKHSPSSASNHKHPPWAINHLSLVTTL